MLESYEAILRDNHVEWCGDPPKSLPSDAAVRVQITLLDKVGAPVGALSQGKQMAIALAKLTTSPALIEISDAAAWEREIRQDRALPSRDE